MSKIEDICLNCHFFCSIGESDRDDRKIIPDLVRELIRKGSSFNILENDSTRKKLFYVHRDLGCYHGVWSEKRDKKLKDKREFNIYQKDRRNSCFFWLYKKEMNLEAAIELQKRDVEDKKLKEERDFHQKIAKRDRFVIKIGVFVATFFSSIQFFKKNTHPLLILVLVLFLLILFFILFIPELKRGRTKDW